MVVTPQLIKLIFKHGIIVFELSKPLPQLPLAQLVGVAFEVVVQRGSNKLGTEHRHLHAVEKRGKPFVEVDDAVVDAGEQRRVVCYGSHGAREPLELAGQGGLVQGVHERVTTWEVWNSGWWCVWFVSRALLGKITKKKHHHPGLKMNLRVSLYVDQISN